MLNTSDPFYQFQVADLLPAPLDTETEFDHLVANGVKALLSANGVSEPSNIDDSVIQIGNAIWQGAGAVRLDIPPVSVYETPGDDTTPVVGQSGGGYYTWKADTLINIGGTDMTAKQAFLDHGPAAMMTAVGFPTNVSNISISGWDWGATHPLRVDPAATTEQL